VNFALVIGLYAGFCIMGNMFKTIGPTRENLDTDGMTMMTTHELGEWHR